MASLVIRNLSDQVHNALRVIAGKAGRPVEAEARIALSGHVEAATAVGHAAGVRYRLTNAFEQTRAAAEAAVYCTDRQWEGGPSYLAFRLGHQDATRVEAWLAGSAVPTFEDLKQIADLLGIDPNWLMFGTGAPYPVVSDRLPEDSQRAVRDLLELDHQTDGLMRLTFVRSSSPEGELYIVKEYRNLHAVTQTTPIHVSEHIGAGGEAALIHLFITLRLLFRIYCGRKAGFMAETIIASTILEPARCAQLASGEHHPQLVLPRNSTPWWEDLWDRGAPRDDYWPNYAGIKNRILSAIDQYPNLVEMIADIERGTLPILSAGRPGLVVQE